MSKARKQPAAPRAAKPWIAKQIVACRIRSLIVFKFTGDDKQCYGSDLVVQSTSQFPIVFGRRLLSAVRTTAGIAPASQLIKAMGEFESGHLSTGRADQQQPTVLRMKSLLVQFRMAWTYCISATIACAAIRSTCF